MNPRFSLGIDLGTSNCAMAVADNDSDSSDVLPVTQIVAANQVGEMRMLPSALYLPHPEEFLAGSFRLPWDAAGPGIVGQFARDHGALVPDRLVLLARRLVERGVRFIQLYHTDWDHHGGSLDLTKTLDNICKEVDQPCAALVKDLKRLGG